MADPEKVKRHTTKRKITEPSPEADIEKHWDLTTAGLSVLAPESVRLLPRRRTEEDQERQLHAKPSIPLETSPYIDLIRRTLDMTGSPERLVRWIYTPLPALGGRIPYEVMQSEGGREAVKAILDALDYGPAYG